MVTASLLRRFLVRPARFHYHVERYEVVCSRGHKPEAPAKVPRYPSLALQACVHGYTRSQTTLGYTSFLRRTASFSLAVLVSAVLGGSAVAEDWPAWRKDGSGVSNETRLPTTWSALENVLWKTPLFGEGFSSPIVCKDKVFITTAAPGVARHSIYYVFLAIFWVLTFAVLWFSVGANLLGSSEQAHRSNRRSQLACGPLAGRLVCVFVFIAVAYSILIVCDEFWTAYPDQSLPLLGLPWKYRVEYPSTENDAGIVRAHKSALRVWEDHRPGSDGTDVRYSYARVPNACFFAGFAGAFAVLALISLLTPRSRPSHDQAIRLTSSRWSGLLSWLVCLLVVAIGGAVLQVPGHHYLPRGSLKVLVAAFVIVSVIQFVLARRHPSGSLAASHGTCRVAGILSWLRAWFILGMAGTFLAAAHTYFLAEVPVADNAEFTTWFAVADLCSIGLIAALGLLPRDSAWRAMGCGITLLALAVLALHGFHSQTTEEWWAKLRASAFHAYGAVAVASCLWFFFEFLRPPAHTDSRPMRSTRAGSLATVSLAAMFLVAMNYLLPKPIQLRQVLGIDQHTGAVAWQTTCAVTEPTTTNPLNTLATPTPATDGRYVYAHFGGVGAYCLDWDGHVVWCYPDPVPMSELGAGSSLVLWQDLIVLTYDVDARSFTVALDKGTGHVRWLADRTPAIRAKTTEMECLSTPILMDRGGACQLVNHSWGYLCGYDLPTGKELWQFPSPGQYTIVSPVVWNHGVIIGGGGDGAGKCLVAVDIDEDRGAVKPREAWRAKRNLPETASPVVYGPYVYVVTRGGVASCLEAGTGKVVWVERLRGQYDASLVAGDGKIYFCNTDGLTTVVAAGETFSVLCRNSLDEPVRASPVIADGKIFLRGEKHLFCIGERP